MHVEFSITTKIKAFPFFMALVLVVICSLVELRNTLIVFGFDVSFYRGLILSIIPFFTGVFLTLTFSFVTPRIDKKLQILNKDYFEPLLNFFYANERSKSGLSIIYLDEAKKTRKDLMKYGKYFWIPCYPEKLVKDIERFFNIAEEHNNLLMMVKQISEERIGKDNLTILFGLLKLSNTNLESYDKDTLKPYEPVTDYIRQEKKELLERITNSIKRVRKMQDDIINEFESFLKHNSLKMREKSKTDDAISVLMGSN